ncbi:hypothetical protein CHU98_g5966 [Xylaria longipes]|nr:hypothetical protein CHU98_g5966 [Xylaria longipes]
MSKDRDPVLIGRTPLSPAFLTEKPQGVGIGSVPMYLCESCGPPVEQGALRSWWWSACTHFTSLPSFRYIIPLHPPPQTHPFPTLPPSSSPAFLVVNKEQTIAFNRHFRIADSTASSGHQHTVTFA